MSYKRILLSVSMIAFVGALVVGATGAFFSDTETSTGNTFTAGAIDLQVANASYIDQGNGLEESESTSWGTLENGGYFFKFSDLKPEDFGEDTITLNVDNNDAWACADIEVTENEENQRTEPEMEVDDTADPNGNMDGELAGEIEFFLWADDGDNVYEQGETPLIQEDGDDNKVTFERFIDGVSYPIADSQAQPQLPNTTDDGALKGGEDYHIGKAWCFGELTPNAVAEGNQNPAERGKSGFECNGSEVGNDTQTDIVEGNVGFRAVQARNNGDFTCEFPQEGGSDVTVNTGDGFAPIERGTGNGNTWAAIGRFGNNNAESGDFEQALKEDSSNVSAQAGRTWTGGNPVDWELSYDVSEDEATWEIGDSTITATMSDNSNGTIGITAKSKSDGSVDVDGVTFNGSSVGSTDGVTEDGSDGGEKQHITLSGLDTSSDWTLSGNVTFSWNSTSDERPAFDIEVEQ